MGAVPVFLIFIAAVVVFSQDLSVHGIEYRDDEIFYFKSTHEMIETGQLFSPTYFGANRFQKPILYYWFIILSYYFFGKTWFAARLVAVIFAALTLGISWLTAARFFNRSIAWLSTVILATVPLFFRHAKNAVPDMPLNFFIVLALYLAVRFYQEPVKIKYRNLFYLACATGFMIKGFAAIVIPLLTTIVFCLWTKRHELLKTFRIPFGFLIMMIVIAPWFIYMFVKFGAAYSDHMLVQETTNRLLPADQPMFILSLFKSFGRNALFYLKTLLNYFAPWSMFLAFVIPWNVLKKTDNEREGTGRRFLLSWFFVVFFFFSAVHVTINHYLLVLSTPFAILTACFLYDAGQRLKPVRVALKALFILVLGLGVAGLSFVHVFLAGAGSGWLIFYAAVFVACGAVIITDRHPVTAPMITGLFIVVVLSQSHIFVRAGVNPHSTLQKIAEAVNGRIGHDGVIGVGSNDLHEKELQVYFDSKVQKLATDETDETREELEKFMREDQQLFCLMIDRDYQKMRNEFLAHQFEVVREDYIFRKRMYLDRGFVRALLNLDRSRIQDYLMEKTVLLQKDRNEQIH